jgi:hypothetical protein
MKDEGAAEEDASEESEEVIDATAEKVESKS